MCKLQPYDHALLWRTEAVVASQAGGAKGSSKSSLSQGDSFLRPGSGLNQLVRYLGNYSEVQERMDCRNKSCVWGKIIAVFQSLYEA